jgi:hypothetical protein
MNLSEKILKVTIFVALGVIIFYSVKCIIFRLKIKENFKSKVQYCHPIFTALGTEVTIRPMNISKYLSIDTNSSKYNVVLNSISLNSWKFERVIERNSLEKAKSGFYNDFSDPSRCSVYIKTESIHEPRMGKNMHLPNSLYYYLTREKNEHFVPGVGNSYVSASLFGNGERQIWYIIDVNELPLGGLYNNVISNSKGMNDTNTKSVFIVTDPIAFINPKESYKTKFLTANLYGNDKSAIGVSNLIMEPTINSIWKIDIRKKGNIEIADQYKPISALNEYPNNDNLEHGVFMNTFLPVWNRTWYSNSKENDSKIKSFSVKLCSPEYNITNQEYSVKNPYSTGTVTFDNYLNNTVYNVKSYGSDMLSSIDYPSKDKSILFLKMVPNNSKPKDKNGKYLIADGVPMLQGWIEKPTDGKKPNIISICASDDENFSGVCLSTNNTDSIQQFLIKKDYLPVKSDINFNLSNSLIENFDTWEKTVNYTKTQCPTLGNLKKCLK